MTRNGSISIPFSVHVQLMTLSTALLLACPSPYPDGRHVGLITVSTKARGIVSHSVVEWGSMAWLPRYRIGRAVIAAAPDFRLSLAMESEAVVPAPAKQHWVDIASVECMHVGTP
jgi:hypothetical protein